MSIEPRLGGNSGTIAVGVQAVGGVGLYGAVETVLACYDRRNAIRWALDCAFWAGVIDGWGHHPDGWEIVGVERGLGDLDAARRLAALVQDHEPATWPAARWLLLLSALEVLAEHLPWWEVTP